MEYYTAMKMNEIRLFAVTWIYLKIIILNEVRKMDKYHMLFFYMKSKKKDTNELIYKIEIDSQRKQSMENNLWLPKGKVEEGYIKSLGLA